MKSMMRRSILAATIMLAARPGMASSAFAATASPDDPLVHLRPGHPRLLMTDAELKAALAAARTDPLRAELNRHIIATAGRTCSSLPGPRSRLRYPIMAYHRI